MTPGQFRRLTEGEAALGRGVFGAEIAWENVRIYQAPRLGFGAMVPLGRTIVFSKWRAAYDFAAAPMWDRGWFVHELTHVWQAERGVMLAGAKLGALGKGAYAYKPAQPLFRTYNIERQAEIVRHLYLARSGEPAQGAPPLAWLEETWASR